MNADHTPLLDHNGGPTLEAKTEFLLATMKVAALNCRTWAVEIDTVGVALRGKLITLDIACEKLGEMGVLRWLGQNETEISEVACDTCGVAPCPDPNFCAACRKADERRAGR